MVNIHPPWLQLADVPPRRKVAIIQRSLRPFVLRTYPNPMSSSFDGSGGAVHGARSDEILGSAEEALAYIKTIPPRQGASMQGVPFEKHDGVVRVGAIGVGGRGASQMKEMLAVEGMQYVAIADRDQGLLDHALGAIEAAGQPKPVVFGPGEDSWKQLCEHPDIDLVYIATGWELHVPMALYAMECGKHAAMEVPAAVNLRDCWAMVDTSERTRKHCIQLENCCYGQQEMMVLNMCNEGKFGTITHGEAAYIHEMRDSLLGPKAGVQPNWRRKAITSNDGNLYPTHGLGPVSWYMGINKGDVFEKMVSMSSPSAALTERRDDTTEEADPRRQEDYVCGDMNTTIIKTAKGRTIMLQHDIVSPRPYTRHNLVQGSKGCFADYPPRLFLDQSSDNEGQMGSHDWEDAGEGTAVMEKYISTSVTCDTA
jgi:predicted dehydrogenase